MCSWEREENVYSLNSKNLRNAAMPRPLRRESRVSNTVTQVITTESPGNFPGFRRGCGPLPVPAVVTRYRGFYRRPFKGFGLQNFSSKKIKYLVLTPVYTISRKILLPCCPISCCIFKYFVLSFDVGFLGNILVVICFVSLRFSRVFLPMSSSPPAPRPIHRPQSPDHTARVCSRV